MAGCKVRRMLVALAFAGIPLGITASCNPYGGTLDLFRYDDHDHGWLDIFIDDDHHDDWYWEDDCCYDDYYYDEIIYFD